jgi:peptide methionine sulfoxide reductase MsrA
MQYTTAIFVHDETQKQLAAASKEELQKRMKVVTEILPAGPFYPAEEYHQDYSKKNPLHYKFYRSHCGRDKRLEQLWGAAPH